MLEEIREKLEADRTHNRRIRKHYKAHEDQIARVATEIDWPKNAIVRATIDSSDVNLFVSGGPDTLNEIFRAFRKLGYEPDKRPGVKPESTFTTYFARPEQVSLQFYVSFTSLVCKRVKVGSKMVEQDIYETVCE